MVPRLGWWYFLSLATQSDNIAIRAVLDEEVEPQTKSFSAPSQNNSQRPPCAELSRLDQVQARTNENCGGNISIPREALGEC